MANNIIRRRVSLDGSVMPEAIAAPLYQQENEAHQFVIEATRDGDVVTLTGTVQARLQRADGQTVAMTGSIAGGKASLTLPQSAYAVPGRFKLAIMNVASGVVTVIYAAAGTIMRTTTDAVIDPGSLIPDLTQLLAEIDEMRLATAAANAAAASALTNFAPAFSSSTAYTAGDYVTYTDGKVYRFTSNHSAGAWNSSHVTAVTVGAEVNKVVHFDRAQSLSSGQKTQARENIGAGTVQEAAVTQLNANVASPFSTGTAYTVGQFVIYEGVLYQFTSNHAAGAWDSSHVTSAATTSYIYRDAQITAQMFDPTANYAAGDYVIYDYRLYQFTADFTHTGSFPSTGIRRTYLGEDVELLQTSLASETSAREAADASTATALAALQADLGNTFDATRAYSIGEFFTRNYLLYYVQKPRAAGAWSDSDVGEGKPFLGAAATSYILRTAGITAHMFDPTANYSAGDYVIFDYHLYQFTEAFTHTGSFPSTGIRRAYLGEDVQLLQGEVSDLKSALNSIEDVREVWALDAGEWVQGSYKTSDGYPNNTSTVINTRIRNSIFEFNTAIGIRVVLPQGVKAYVCIYNNDTSHTYIGWNNEWLTGTFEIYRPDKCYRITAAYIDDSQISAETVGPTIQVYAISPTDTSLSIPGKAADAAVVGGYVSGFSTTSSYAVAAIQSIYRKELPLFENLIKGAHQNVGGFNPNSIAISTREIFRLNIGTKIQVELSDGWIYSILEGNSINTMRMTHRLTTEDTIVTTKEYVYVNLYKTQDGEPVDTSVSEYAGQVVMRIVDNSDSIDLSEYTRDMPDNAGVANVVRRAYQLTKATFTALKDIPNFGSRIIHEDSEFTGIPYSSVRPENLYIPNCVSLNSFMTALKNPNSYIYTRRMSIPGYSGHCYMGAVCSSFVAWCYGIDDTLPTTVSFADYPGFNELPANQQNWQNVKLGDMLNKPDSHIVIITDVYRNRFGDTAYIEVSESTDRNDSKAISTIYYRDRITQLINNGYRIYRYDGIADVTYVESPWVHVDSSEKSTPVYNDVIIPRRGDNANWHEGENIEIDILQPTGYTGYELEEYRDIGTVVTGQISGDLITLSNLPAGAYRLRLTGDVNSKWTYFDIRKTQGTTYETMSGRKVKVTPYINRGEPASVCFCCNNPNNGADHLAVRSFHIFTAEEISAGYAIVDAPPASQTYAVDDVWYMRCLYKTVGSGLYSGQLTYVDVSDTGATATEGAYERSQYIVDYPLS